MAYRIIYDWHTNCSECGGNADMYEPSHIHGGPDPGRSMGPKDDRSTLDRTNGCGATFDEPDQWR